ncbi:flagellar basal body P-ring formation chaperone FlgA [Shewanella maritima]|uniref:flagellar basal body P-ring formation chaperone FlgA n=1 Tax=Shewanella maritima TaxID=2520507 RepID=UPI0037356146
MKVNFLIIFSLYLNILPAFAGEEFITPSLSTLNELAKEAVAKKIEPRPNSKINILPQSLDGRQPPPRCIEPITATLATDRPIGRTNTVKISCNSPDLAYPWQIYLSVRVEVLFPVVIANEIISPGEVLTLDQISTRYIDQYSLRGDYYSQISDVVGTRVKRRVSKETPILKRNLCFVCKGDAVSIWAITPSLQIKTLGEAMRDGNVGDVIRVKNTNSNKQIDAIVIGVGEVEVKM